MKNFELIRSKDESGVSGTGVVAEGIVFSNGVCVISWLRPIKSATVYQSVAEMIIIHGHEGSTIVRYL